MGKEDVSKNLCYQGQRIYNKNGNKIVQLVIKGEFMKE